MSSPEKRHENFTSDEINALRGIFTLYDPDKTGEISAHELESLLEKIGYTGDSKTEIIKAASGFESISFDAFLDLLVRGNPAQPGETADPKVMEFLRILEEYRVKCEEEGNYLEAGRAHEQLDTLRKQEEKRQQKAVRARQINERSDVQVAHNMQYADFNAAWDRYLEEYDKMAQMYIQQMTERHAVHLLDFQRTLQTEMAERPPKWSRELLEWRRRQHMLARQKNYAEAQRIKKIADKLEDREKKTAEQQTAALFARKEAQFRQQQQAELQALLKRIDARRKEHIKQRNLDSKRLMQRNRNVQAVLESKQAVESNRIFSDIRKNLYAATYTGRSAQTGSMSSSGGRVPTSEKKSRKSGGKKGKTTVADEEVPSGPAGEPDMTFLTAGDEEKRQG